VSAPEAKGVRPCKRCGGVFADNDASRRIVTSLDRVLLEIGFVASAGKARAKETGRALTCPECLVAMQKIRIESAACEIDACPAHGSWFDAGELQDVMRAYARSRRAGGLSPVRPPMSGEDIMLREAGRANEPATGPTLLDWVRDELGQ
jgi:Zn-finger nucleic acid-binding protein